MNKPSSAVASSLVKWHRMVAVFVDFEVMIRPFNSLQVLGDEMGKRLGQILPACKVAGPAP